MKKGLIERWIKSFRIDENVKVFIHNKVSDLDLQIMFLKTGLQDVDKFKDHEAHIIAVTDTAIEYRMGNEIYFVPATIKAVVNNNDGKISMWFDYPCEMKREDLVEY